MARGEITVKIHVKHPWLTALNEFWYCGIKAIKWPPLTRLMNKINVWFLTRWCIEMEVV